MEKSYKITAQEKYNLGASYKYHCLSSL